VWSTSSRRDGWRARATWLTWARLDAGARAAGELPVSKPNALSHLLVAEPRTSELESVEVHHRGPFRAQSGPGDIFARVLEKAAVRGVVDLLHARECSPDGWRGEYSLRESLGHAPGHLLATVGNGVEELQATADAGVSTVPYVGSPGGTSGPHGFGDDQAVFVVWTMPGRDFVCAEAWRERRGALDDRTVVQPFGFVSTTLPLSLRGGEG
jgi:hypothetical protein